MAEVGSRHGRRKAASLGVRLAGSRFARRHGWLGRAIVARLHLELTDDFDRLSDAVVVLRIRPYRRAWLVAAARLLALAAGSNRREIAARRIAGALAGSPFLFEASADERQEIVSLVDQIGVALLLSRLRSPADRRALATFLAITSGDQAGQCYAELEVLRPPTPEDRARMARKLLGRYEARLIDEEDMRRFARRMGGLDPMLVAIAGDVTAD